MTDISINAMPKVSRRPKERAAEITLPKPQPFGAPVFITDAATPLAGETVLSLLWKRLARDADQSR